MANITLIPANLKSDSRGFKETLLISADNLSENYQNEIELKAFPLMSHPSVVAWRGGKYEAFSFKVYLICGIQLKGYKTLDDMLVMAKNIRNLAITDQKPKPPPLVGLTIGKWFYWSGVMKSVKVNFNFSFGVDGGGFISSDGNINYTGDVSPRCIELDCEIVLAKFNEPRSRDSKDLLVVDKNTDFRIHFR